MSAIEYTPAKSDVVDKLRNIHLGAWAQIREPNGWEYETNIGVLTNEGADAIVALRAERDDWKYKHNNILLPQCDRHGETITRLRAELEAKTKAVEELSIDMHNTSKRPCKTCRDMTNAFGFPFGCNRLTAHPAKNERLTTQSLANAAPIIPPDSALVSPEVIRAMEYGAEIIRKTEAEIDEAGLVHTCGDCGQELQTVRPGKYQCINPECQSNADAV